MPQLVIGNVTSEYMFGCSLASFGTKGTHKQHAISTRTAWLLHNGDAMLTHRPLTPEFRTYLASVLDLRSVTLLSMEDGRNTSTFADQESLLSADTVDRLRRITDRSWTLTPYLYDRSIAALARELALDVSDADLAFFAQGGSDVFNSKSFFRIWATGLGVPVAPGQVCRNRGAIARAVVNLLPHTGSVIVKEDFSASGYGNVLFTQDSSVPALGASTTHVVDDGISAKGIEALLASSFPAVSDIRDFPVGLRPSETIVEVYYPNSRTLYSEVQIAEAPYRPSVLNYGDMRMEPIWNGFAVPPIALPSAAQDTMLEWSVTMAEYLQQTGYRGYLNCDSILTQDGRLLFNEVNARIGGCTHMHFAAQRVLGPDYLQHYTLLTRNDLQVTSFEKLAWGIARNEHLNGHNGTSGALLLVDDVPYTGTVQYLTYGKGVGAAQETEQRLQALAAAC
ncbi:MULTISPECIES: preATP grasp domain-containing protein [Streptomyces]|uniref:Uncharacterized protein n=5 Tax=Streptomyces rimosus TaxID=1927 RepID=L8F0B2_STRR1|nr:MULTISPECIES: hypothetical protein [Streptomyces]KOG73067.1 hypothetical protein ADK78_17555 [Kitasatospora aureofaciens]MYT42083.1 hypothetical protein [Streptomyces sp. SID5471]KEF04835.1 hypothetical protein DF17_21550 [Streptomyces rimosus]KOT32440.1 hypothetical protein ADK84_28130 [Streptomyces sp. NRRL WC-3701]KOT38617.1 hypothetical protein ADK42_16835 [Streptomyces rimosus subsp. rimosus]